MTDHGDPISYQALQRGTPISSSDDVELGAVERVIDNAKEHIFDGIVMRTGDGLLWVDAPEVARITTRRVTLTIDAAAAAQLPERDPKGGTEYRANVRGRFGRLWRRRR